VCARAAVGVDIEQIRVVDEAATIAQRFFSKAEHAELCTLPESDRSLAFMRCWTRKEAYLKATGDGLSAPLDQFDVTISASEPARMRVLEGSAERAAAWSLHSLAPADGYVGALAVFGCAWRIKCRSLSPARLRLPHP